MIRPILLRALKLVALKRRGPHTVIHRRSYLRGRNASAVRLPIFGFAVLLCLLGTTRSLAQSNSVTFSFPERGGVSLTTAGLSLSVGVGYATLTETGAIPAGFA